MSERGGGERTPLLFWSSGSGSGIRGRFRQQQQQQQQQQNSGNSTYHGVGGVTTAFTTESLGKDGGWRAEQLRGMRAYMTREALDSGGAAGDYWWFFPPR